MIRESSNIFHQLLSTGARKSLSGTLRSAVLLCVLALMPAVKAHAVVEKAAIYDGETLLWRCMQLTTAGTYDDAPYSLRLRVFAPTSDEATLSICEGETLLWRCQQVAEEGYYYDTLRSREFPNMDSVYYRLKLDVIAPIEVVDADIHISDGVTVLWRCLEISEPGTYHDTIRSKRCETCDSIRYTVTVVEDLPTIHDPEAVTAYVRDTLLWRCRQIVCDRLCPTDSVIMDTVWGGSPLHATDIYQLNLKITCAPVKDVEESATICKGEEYEWYDGKHSVADDYEYIFKDVFGCDSIHYTLKLSVVDPVEHDAEKITAIVRDTVLWRCQQIVCDKLCTDSLFTDTIFDGGKCASDVYYLKLTVGCAPLAEADAEEETICKGETLTWHGMPLTTAGDYEFTEQSKVYPSCDSIHYTLKLSVVSPVEHDAEKITANVRDTVLWRCQQIVCDKLCTDSLFTDTIFDGGKCATDVYYLKLTVGCAPLKEADHETETICKGETLTWHGMPLTVADDYEFTEQSKVYPSCDSIHYTLTLSVVDPVEHDAEKITANVRDTVLWRCKQIVCDKLCVDSLFTDTIFDGGKCATDVYYLKLTVGCAPLAEADAEEETICKGETLTWHGMPLTTAGDYEFTEQSKVYPTCDSIHYTLTLSVIAPIEHDAEKITAIVRDTVLWRCKQIVCDKLCVDSLFTDTIFDGGKCATDVYYLKLTVGCAPLAEADAEEETICKGEMLTWHGMPLTTAGGYEFTEQSKVYPSCDSIHYTLTLSVVSPVEHDAEKITAIVRDTVLWRCKQIVCDKLCTDSLFTDTIFDGGKCASDVYYLKLTVGCAPLAEADAEEETICKGETLTWHGMPLTTAGDYEFTEQSKVYPSCDSIHYTLTLSVVDPVEHDAEKITANVRDTVLWRCQQIVCDKLCVDSLFTDTIFDGGKCASDVYYLKLTVGCAPLAEADAEEETICKGETLTWHGMPLTTAGDYEFTEQSKVYPSCDSIHYTLTLNVVSPVEHDAEKITANVRDTVLWRCKQIVCDKLCVDSLFTDTIFDGGKCASDVYYLKLTVGCAPLAEADAEEETICKGETLTWHGMPLTTAGDYEFTEQSKVYPSCDSIHYTLTLSVVSPVEHDAEKITANVRDTVLWRCQQIVCDELCVDSLFTDTIYGGTPSCATDIYYLELTVGCAPLIEAEHETETICKGETLTWHGMPLTTAGDYEFTEQSKVYPSCDSIHYTLTLSVVSPVEHDAEKITAIVRDTVLWRCQQIVCDKLCVDSLFTDTIYGGTPECATDIYYLELTVECAKEDTIVEPDKTLCEGATFEWYGETLTAEKDSTYEHRVRSKVYDCDSILFQLPVHVILLEKEQHDTARINLLESYTWHTWRGDNVITGTVVCQDSILGDTLWSDSPVCPTEIYVLHLYVGCPDTTEIIDSLTYCGHDTILWRCQLLTESGTYYDTVKSVVCEECDSIHYTFTLTYNKDSIAPAIEVTLCNNDSVFWDEKWIKEEGEYQYWTHYPLTPAQIEQGLEEGCDSVLHTLNVHVMALLDTTMYDTICDPLGDHKYTWTSWHDTIVTIPEDVVNMEYTFTDTVRYMDSETCDSVRYTMKVFVRRLEQRYYVQGDTVCGAVPSDYKWNPYEGRELPIILTDEESALEGKHIIARYDTVRYTPLVGELVGCDSAIYELNLHVFKPLKDTIEIDTTLCYNGSLDFLDKSYTESGVYRDTIRYADTECDSAYYRINLTIRSVRDTALTDTICDVKKYTWHSYRDVEVDIPDEAVTKEYVFYDTARYADMNDCDSVRYTMTVTVRRTDGRYFIKHDTICGEIPSEGYEWNPYPGRVVYVVPTAQEASDPIITRKDTARYTRTDKGYECDSAYYELNLHIFRALSDTAVTDTTICYSDMLKWRDKYYFESGTYRDTAKYAGTDCDSAYFRLQLKVRDLPTTDDDGELMVCEGSSVNWQGKWISEPGEHIDTVYYAGTQCDSLYHKVNLIVLSPTYADTVHASFCEGGTFLWNGHIDHVLTEPGYYYDTLRYTIPNMECDSIIYTLHLSAIVPVEVEPADTAYICNGETYSWHGKTYDVTGTYRDTVRSLQLCDSLYYTLVLEKQAPMEKYEETLYICNEGTVFWPFNGKTYDHEGDYDDVIQSQQGCDSIAGKLHVRRRETIRVEEDTTIYQTETYTWRDGKEYSEAGTYTYAEQFVGSDCDSVVYILTLTVMNVDPKPVDIKDIVCAGDSVDGREVTTHSQWSKTIHTRDAEGALVDSIYNYDIDVYDNSMPEGFMKFVIAACGQSVNVDSAMHLLQQHIDNTPNYALNAEITWLYSTDGGTTWQPVDGETSLEGNIEEVQVRCVLQTDCDSVAKEERYAVSKHSTPETYVEYDRLPVVVLYNGTMFMVDVSAVCEKFGWQNGEQIKPEDVQWYRIVGAMDNLSYPAPDDPKDTPMNKWGYYYTPEDEQSYYALIKGRLEVSEGDCGVWARTIEANGTSPVQLQPNVSEPNGTITITQVSECYVSIHDMIGTPVMERTKVSGSFKAPNASGTYFVTIETGVSAFRRTLIVY